MVLVRSAGNRPDSVPGGKLRRPANGIQALGPSAPTGNDDAAPQFSCRTMTLPAVKDAGASGMDSGVFAPRSTPRLTVTLPAGARRPGASLSLSLSGRMSSSSPRGGPVLPRSQRRVGNAGELISADAPPSAEEDGGALACMQRPASEAQATRPRYAAYSPRGQTTGQSTRLRLQQELAASSGDPAHAARAAEEMAQRMRAIETHGIKRDAVDGVFHHKLAAPGPWKGEAEADGWRHLPHNPRQPLTLAPPPSPRASRQQQQQPPQPPQPPPQQGGSQQQQQQQQRQQQGPPLPPKPPPQAHAYPPPRDGAAAGEEGEGAVVRVARAPPAGRTRSFIPRSSTRGTSPTRPTRAPSTPSTPCLAARRRRQTRGARPRT